ncbi:MAG: rod shape-determining protein MreC [Anaerolineae bacterium]|nr:rod shape-determining protein MreC [Anaerolineae bacterium]
MVVGLLFLALGGYLTPLTRTLLNPVLGAQGWVTSRYQAFQDIFNAPSDLARLRQRETELETELANLQTEYLALQQRVTEVEILSALLDFARAQPDNKYQAAAVIARDPSPFLKYVIINRGSDHGLRRGMPVVSNQGLVGRVTAVTANAARVQLITDPASAINVRIQSINVDVILSGSITGDISLSLIPQDAAVVPGDPVQTSGLGGNYPPNILVGQISTVRKESTALFQTASVQPAVDFFRLEIVLVILNFHPIDIDPLIPEASPGR